MYAASEFSGYFDFTFWRQEILQASQYQPAIRSAIVSLGALYRKFISSSLAQVPGSALDDYEQDALGHCTRAIQMLVRVPAQPSESEKMTVLTVCILFSCSANLDGDYRLAMEHFQSGLLCLNEDETITSSQNRQHVRHSVTSESLQAVYSRLYLLARGIDCQRQLPILSNRRNYKDNPSSTSATSEQACAAVGRLLHELLTRL
jgi:hypothetical protein